MAAEKYEVVFDQDAQNRIKVNIYALKNSVTTFTNFSPMRKKILTVGHYRNVESTFLFWDTM